MEHSGNAARTSFDARDCGGQVQGVVAHIIAVENKERGRDGRRTDPDTGGKIVKASTSLSPFCFRRRLAFSEKTSPATQVAVS
jgi:hypothetical protein